MDNDLDKSIQALIKYGYSHDYLFSLNFINFLKLSHRVSLEIQEHNKKIEDANRQGTKR